MAIMTRQAALFVMTLTAGCGDDDAPSPPHDMTGSYSVAVTNGANGCGFPNWRENESSQNVPFNVSQSGANATGIVEGLTGVFVALWLGTRSYSGTISGSSVTMTAFGTNSHREGECSYTINSTIDGSLLGDALQGTITYTAKTNGSPACGTREGCRTTQSFSGSRPPR
jgi:hypothetical protein